MRRLLAILLLISVPVMVFSADRAAGTYSIGGFGGLGMPQKPDFIKDYFKSAIGFGGEFKYNMNETTSFGLGFTYLPFKLDADKMADLFDGGFMKPSAEGLTIEGGNMNVSVISANFIKYFSPPSASAGFYLTLGGGYYMMKPGDTTIKYGDYPEETIKGGDSDNKFGLNGGLGLEFKAGESLNLFVEGKYHYVFTKDEEDTEGMAKVSADSDVPDSSGKFQFITIMAGLRFGLGN